MRAGVYTRISRDDIGDEAGTDRQLQDCRKYIDAKGWEFVAEYRENDVSASKGLPRPQYDQIISDAVEGRLEVVVVASVDRLYREPRELEDLIDTVKQHGVLIVNVHGMLDLSNENGQMVARMLGATAKNEADRIGVRVKRQKQQRAEQGIPQGGKYRVLGYSRDWQIIDDEKATVERIFTARATGASATALANTLNAEGVTTVSGNTWNAASINRIITQPIYMGKRRYHGQIVGDLHPDIQHFISPSVWEKANSDVAKRAGGFNTRRYLLSGFLRCGACLGHVNGKPGLYRCDSKSGGCGNVSIRTDYTDVCISHEVVKRGDVTEEEDNTEEIDAQVRAVENKITDLRNKHTQGMLDLDDYIVMKASFTDQIKNLKSQIKVTASPGNLAENDLEFGALSLEEKRTQIGKHVKYIVLNKSTKKGPVFDMTRLVIHWTDGTTSTPDLSTLYPVQEFIDAVNKRYGTEMPQ